MKVRAELVAAFIAQSRACERLGSPFTARVLAAAADDLRRGGPLGALVGEWPGDPVRDVLALRVAGALHALALSGSSPDLAALYPPHGGAALPILRAAIAAAVAGHGPHFTDYLASPPQTNEVGRAAALLGGFLEIAKQARRPLRLLEIGASAGLNLHWDRYRYRLGAAEWGDPSSAVLISPVWSGPLPPLDAPLRVASRAGCDRAAIDPADPAQVLRLRSYVWADQHERLALLDRAIAVASGSAVRVERADAGEWTERQLAARGDGVATVLYHSIVWQYLPHEVQARIGGAIEAAGRLVSPESPLAWLRLEPSGRGSRPDLLLTLWPGAVTRRLAVAHWHGTEVDWLPQ